MASIAAESKADSDAGAVDPYWRKRLEAFYRKYNPEKLEKVDGILTKYKGFELRLFKELVKRYGEEPLPDEDGDAREDVSDSNEEEESEPEDDDAATPAELDAVHDKPLDPSSWPYPLTLCNSCGLPYEFCEYSQNARFAPCVQELLKNRPHLMLQKKGKTVLEAFGGSAVPEGDPSVGESKQADATAKNEPERKVEIDPNDPRAAKKALKRERKRLAQEKKAKAKAKSRSGPTVLVSMKKRTKRKYIVTITGLEKFGVKLKDAAKSLSKKFACSASVSKNAMGGKEVVMQGNVSYDITDVLCDKYPSVPRDAVIINEN